MSTNANQAAHGKKLEVIVAFLFGIVFLTVILVVTFYKPNPTPFEYTVYRIVIALAAAGVGAILPGFLDVRFKNWLRAGGALALFVVVYFFRRQLFPLVKSLSARDQAPMQK